MPEANRRPPLGLHYAIAIIGESEKSVDAAFQEVSGISASLETTTIKEGGESRFAYTVPSGHIQYDDLVLKRGLVASGSVFTKWCKSQLENGLNKGIQPKLLQLQLLTADAKPIMSWYFANAYPKKWEVTGFTAERSEIVIETITLCYAYFMIDELQ